VSAGAAGARQAPVTAAAALGRAGDLVAPALDAAVGRLGAELREPVLHHLAGGGKRVRAALVLVSAAAAGGEEADGLPGAVAIELIHNYSLIHDDIIDGDRERRHRPSVWAAFGIGRAIVAGDALATLATQLLLEAPGPHGVAAAAALAEATQAMIEGQSVDMAFETREAIAPEECLAMEQGKTGALLSCAAAMGPILVGAPPAVVRALSDFGSDLGIAFQAVDDVLGIWGEPSRTGKPVGSDLVSHKKSLPIAIALAGPPSAELSRLAALLDGSLEGAELAEATALIEATGARDAVMAVAEERLAAALAALDRVPLAERPHAELAAIARFVTERDQ
jgi:geranylgeranyl diphosphate synthase, type I